MNEKEKCIKVLGKNGRYLPSCTKKRAAKLVNRQCAKWIGPDELLLLVDSNDRKRLRMEIVQEAGRECYICGTIIPLEEAPTLDHLITRSQGGRDVKENLRCSCKRCNDDRGDLSLTQYVRHIRIHRTEYSYITEDRLANLGELALSLRTGGVSN